MSFFDWLGLLVGVVLTLFVFSYLLHDSPLFRLAQAIFVGVAVGYAVTIAFKFVLIPYLVDPLFTFTEHMSDPNYYGYAAIALPPLVLGLLLFAKLRANWSPLGNIPIAFLFGVGGALAIGGALSGALWPQLSATFLSLAPASGNDAIANVVLIFSNLVLIVGTIGALLSFRFVTSPTRPAFRALDVVAQGWGRMGRWFVLIAFGAIFAETAVARITTLITQVSYLWQGLLAVAQGPK